MFNNFDGFGADEVWVKALTQFGKLNLSIQPSRGGNTIELLHSVFSIQNPRERWVVSRQPAINPAFAIVEVICLITGGRDAKILNFYNTQLPRFAGNRRIYHGAYGYRLRSHFGFDQLDRACSALLHNGESRQIVLQMWDPSVDFPTAEGMPSDQDIPCNVCSLVKLRDGRLEWMQIIRSNDLFLGVPYNLVQFTFLQEILAGWLGSGIGEYNQLSDSLHIYDRDLHVLASLDKTVVPRPNTDTIGLNQRESKKLFCELSAYLDRFVHSIHNQNQLRQICIEFDAPQGFKNLLYLVGAETARRYKWKKLSEELISFCSNSLFEMLWRRWIQRLETTFSNGKTKEAKSISPSVTSVISR